MEYTFSNTWFNYQKQFIERIVPPPPADQPYHILEIGAFEGAGTTYYIDHFLHHPGSTITTVDPFDLKDSTCSLEEGTYQRFCANIKRSKYPFKSRLIAQSSRDALPLLFASPKRFDFISIDGSHLTEDVLFDAVLSFDLLKSGGILLFDDYLQTYETSSGPKLAIDSFLACNAPHLDVLHKDYHVFVRKH